MDLTRVYTTLVVVAVALTAGHAHSAVYKCKTGSQIVYSDKPCHEAKVVNTTNGKTPELADQYMARARALRDKAKIDESISKDLTEQRERAGCQEMAARHNVTMETAAKYPRDAWWVHRADSSAANLHAQCGKHLIPSGAR